MSNALFDESTPKTTNTHLTDGANTPRLDRRKSDHQLRDDELRYRTLFETIQDGILVVNEQGRYVDVNEAYCRLIGATKESLIGEAFAQFIPEDRLEEAKAAFVQLKETGWYKGEFPLKRTDGSVIELDWVSKANFLPGLSVCVAKDITHIKRARLAQEQSQKRVAAGHALTRVLNRAESLEEAWPLILKILAESISGQWSGYWNHDKGTAELECLNHWSSFDSPSVKQFAIASKGARFGVGVGLPGRVWKERRVKIIHDFVSDSNFPRAKHVSAAGFSSGLAFPVVDNDEFLGVIEIFSFEKIRADSEMYSMVSAFGQEIGQFVRRRRAEVEVKRLNKALQQRVNELQTVMDVLPIGLAIAEDPQCQNIVPNKQLVDMVGMQGIKNLSKTGPESAHLTYRFMRDGVEITPEELPMQKAARLGRAVIAEEIDLVLDSGEMKNLFVNAQPLFDSQSRVRGAVGAHVDITAIKETEKALKGSEHRYHQLTAQLELRVAQRTAELVESQASLAEAQRLAHIGSWEWDIAKNRLLWSDELYRIYGLKPQEFEATYEAFVALVHPDDRSALHAAIAKAYDTFEPFHFFHRLVRPNGQVRIVQANGYVDRDSTGKPARMVGTGQDVTEWKLAEEQLAKQAQELARSNAELEQFAYVASHDLREPLRTVNSYTQLLAKRYMGKFDADGDRFVTYITDGVTRMHKLIEDLLAYSRVARETVVPDLVDTNQVVDRLISDFKAYTEENGVMIARENLPVIKAHPSQITQLFQNLIGNALKFRGGESPRVEISAKHVDAEWVFSVKDNGIGIDPAYFERIFVIFQRLHTREEYPGTGIGLAICKKIVHRHGGRIWVESELGKGATFHFSIPV